MKNSVDPTVLSLHLKTRYLHKIIENSTPDGECIMWDKSLNTSGYPQMRFCFPGSNSQRFLVHRIVFSFPHNVILDNHSGMLATPAIEKIVFLASISSMSRSLSMPRDVAAYCSEDALDMHLIPIVI